MNPVAIDPLQARWASSRTAGRPAAERFTNGNTAYEGRTPHHRVPIGVAAVCGTAASATHATAPDAEGRKTALRAVVKRALAECQVAGGAVGVWTPKGDWSLITGRADVASGRKVARDDRFAIRSITKSFVVTLILQLDADGRLSLDDPIARYVPGVPQGGRIKLRNLADIPAARTQLYHRPELSREALGRNPRRQWQPAELIGYALRHPLNFAPGTAYEYSNTNTVLLGEVVERVTGRSVAQGCSAASSIRSASIPCAT